jgi:hypothetical protein
VREGKGLVFYFSHSDAFVGPLRFSPSPVFISSRFLRRERKREALRDKFLFFGSLIGTCLENLRGFPEFKNRGSELGFRLC